MSDEFDLCTCSQPLHAVPADPEDAQPTEHGAWLVWVAVVGAIGALVGYVLVAAGGS